MCVCLSNLHQQRVCGPAVDDTPSHFWPVASAAVVTVDGVQTAAYLHSKHIDVINMFHYTTEKHKQSPKTLSKSRKNKNFIFFWIQVSSSGFKSDEKSLNKSTLPCSQYIYIKKKKAPNLAVLVCAGWLTEHIHIFTLLHFAFCIDLASELPVYLHLGNNNCSVLLHEKSHVCSIWCH